MMTYQTNYYPQKIYPIPPLNFICGSWQLASSSITAQKLCCSKK